MIEAFGKTAKMLMDAGVDGVEIHAVHEGYLLDQFAIANMNYRTDEYGGSFENRYRFAVEIVQEIKKLCGKDFPVSLRYSVVSKTKGFGGVPSPARSLLSSAAVAESEKAIKYLEDAGYDMFNAITAPTTPGTGRIRRSICRPTATLRMSSISRTSPPSRSSAPVRWSPSSLPRRSPRAASTRWASAVRTRRSRMDQQAP